MPAACCSQVIEYISFYSGGMLPAPLGGDACFFDIVLDCVGQVAEEVNACFQLQFINADAIAVQSCTVCSICAVCVLDPVAYSPVSLVADIDVSLLVQQCNKEILGHWQGIFYLYNLIVGNSTSLYYVYGVTVIVGFAPW